MRRKNSTFSLKSCIITIAFFSLFVFYLTFKSLVFELNNDKYSEIVKLRGNANVVSYVTVVTVLFKLNKSKHMTKFYDEWSNKMIQSLGLHDALTVIIP